MSHSQNVVLEQSKTRFYVLDQVTYRFTQAARSRSSM